ncbi:MAG: TonB-dependent receptor [Shimia sp.]|nr:TonB-dependent receptor [Shimia sp.]MCP4827043.1 TonB-dependent receptor [Shimia sp.]
MTVSPIGSRARLLGSCFAAALPATIATAEDLEDSYYTLDTITIEQQDEQNGEADRGASVYVADAELERARTGDMKDVFAGIANVSVGGAIPIAQKIFVNGVDMLNLVVSVDGVLQNNRGFHHVSANVFDPGFLKFVRVDPGVAAADTGPNAVAGAVIMETVDASDVVADGETFGGNVRLNYADNGKTLNASTTLAGVADGFEYLIYGRSVTGDNYEDGSGVESSGTAANMQSGLLKLAYESETGHRFELSGQALRDDELRNARANFGNGWPLVNYDSERNTYAFNYSQTNATGMWDPEVVLGYSQSYLHAPVTPGYNSHNDTNTLSGKFQNTFNLSETNTIVAGLDFYDRTGHYYDDNRSIKENAKNIGVFAQARFEPGERWKISTGLRADFQSLKGTDGSKNDYSGLSGNFSAIYDLTDQLALRGGYSNVFGGVPIEDAYVFDPSWDYASLSATRSQNINLGLDWTSGNFQAGGEVFQTDVKNAREAAGNFDFATEGLNLYASYVWGLGSARFTYSDTEATRDGRLMHSGDIVDYGAPLGKIMAFEVMHRIPQANDLIVGGSLDVALDYNPTYDSARPWPTQGLEGYEVLNLFAEYTPPSLPNLTFRGEVLNVFDKDYSDRASYGGDFPGFTPIKEPGRTLVLTAVARF